MGNLARPYVEREQDASSETEESGRPPGPHSGPWGPRAGRGSFRSNLEGSHADRETMVAGSATATKNASVGSRYGAKASAPGKGDLARHLPRP